MRKHAAPTAIMALAASALAGCKPDLGNPPSLVEGPRILAVKATPAEAAPAQGDIHYELLAVTPGGRLVAGDAAWALCLVPKPPSESNTVSAACRGSDLKQVVSMGVGASAMGSMPPDACSLFGPNPPQPKKGELPGRPRDPDTTGGYYQPVRVVVPAPGRKDPLVGFALERIACGLAGVPIDIAARFAMGYAPNTNPEISAVTFTAPGGAESDALAPGGMVPPGAAVTLIVRWTEASAETFPVYDLARHDLVDHRESIRVSWFTTAGELALDHSGRTGDDMDTTASNVWTTPVAPGPVHLWVVARDSRGGAAFEELALTVQ